jgi:peptidoglycan/xylan/chitin deacetylase (PgdA/CDA1 family)
MLKAFIKRFIVEKIPSSIVLLYHRITEKEEKDIYKTKVSLKNFEEQIEVIKKFACPIEDIFSLKPKGKVLLTFDDGYKDNFDYAKKILEKHGVGAVFFITTGFLGKKYSWYDKLEEIFLTGKLKKNFYLQIDENTALEIELERNEEEIDILSPFAHPKTFEKISKQKLKLKKSELFALLYRKIKYSKNPDALFEKVKNSISDDEKEEMSERNYMTEDEVAELGKNFLIGAHTETHRPLSILEEREQETEMLLSAIKLEKICNRKIELFAYPFGLKEDFNKKTLELAKRIFKLSFTGIKGQVYFLTPRNQIPRFAVMNWNGEIFEKKLIDFFFERRRKL